jgi:hypothetical protein
LDDHSELFASAALVARDPDQWQNVQSLTEDQQDALALEQRNKWAGPFALYFAMLVCALGASVQGWDQTGSNGANLSFPVEFGLVPRPEPEVAARSLFARAGSVDTNGQKPTRGDWIVGAINAAPYMSAAFP